MRIEIARFDESGRNFNASPVQNDADYIARTCSPEAGYLTRTLAALELAVGALELYRAGDDQLAGFKATKETNDPRSAARVAMERIENVLKGK